MRLDKQYSVVALRVAVFLWFFGPGRFGALFGRALFLLPGASGHRMGLSFRPGTGVLLLFHFTGIGVGCVFVPGFGRFARSGCQGKNQGKFTSEPGGCKR